MYVILKAPKKVNTGKLTGVAIDSGAVRTRFGEGVTTRLKQFSV